MESTSKPPSDEDPLGTFAVRFRLDSSAASTILRVSSDPSAMIPLQAQVFLEFDGRSPYVPGVDHRITEDGAVSGVPLFVLIWDLVASCVRLIQARGSKEEVPFPPTNDVLELERRDEMSIVRLRPNRPDSLALAETRVSLRELGRSSIMTGHLLFTWMTSTNPELKGNIRLQRFRHSLEELGKATFAGGQSET